jgi:gamma-butyrobetaine dioxygenase
MPEIRAAEDGAALLLIAPGEAPRPIHPLWLRERCRTAHDLDPTTQQRLFNPATLPSTLAIRRVEASGQGRFFITFSDGHGATFDASNILAELPAYAEPGLPARLPWNASTAPAASIDWAACSDTRTFTAALENFLTLGYIILDNVPRREGAVLEVARRFGYPRETNFGTLFDVRSMPGANDLAYTPRALDPHTDNPYRAPVPGIQLLHCLSNQTQGGLSTLVDGLAVAEHLRANAPSHFDSLAATPVRFRFTDAAAELTATAPIIERGHAGQVAAIHYSPRLDFVPLLPHDTLTLFYAARAHFDRLLSSPAFERKFRLAEGQLIMFSNRRLLHGRTSYDPQEGTRHLQGCYIDADAPASLYRVLQRTAP